MNEKIQNQRMAVAPSPFLPREVDLRDFPFMPLDVGRLRDSDFAAVSNADEFRAGLLLLCAAWHQLPAGSLPNDDVILARLAGYGRVQEHWLAVREGALRGWVECSDHRLYHPVISEKALTAWNRKLQQRWRTECARIKKHNQRHGSNITSPSFQDYIISKATDVPRDSNEYGEGHSIQEIVDSDRNMSITKTTTFAHSADVIHDAKNSLQIRLNELCESLNQIGITSDIHSSSWPELLEMFPDKQIIAAAISAKAKKPNSRIHINYLIPILRDQKNEIKTKKPKLETEALIDYGQGGAM